MTDYKSKIVKIGEYPHKYPNKWIFDGENNKDSVGIVTYRDGRRLFGGYSLDELQKIWRDHVDQTTIDYNQEWEDSEGNPPTMPAGTKVYVGPAKQNGTVLLQKLHYDIWESFFGNVIVELENGERVETHCWLCRKIDEK